ncbi:MAG TPA: hypothetical protein VFZ56_00690 [Gemmatimonadaceae bacterium]
MTARGSNPAARSMSTSGSSPAARVAWIAPVMLIAVFIGMAWALRAPDITLEGDDALYLLLSESLRDFNYRETFLVGHPTHSQYPPGYPALLAVASLLMGSRPEHLVIVGILAAAGGLAGLWLAARSIWGPWIAAGTVAVAGLNPGLIHISGLLMSEAPFFALAIIALWAAQRQGGRRAVAIAIVASIAAALTRAVGVTVVVAVLIAWLLERRWRAASILALCAALTVGPWLVWTFTAPNQNPDRSYASDAAFGLTDSLQRATGPEPATASGTRPDELPGLAKVPAALVRRVAANTQAYATRELPWVLPAAGIPGTTVDNWLWLVAIVVFGAAGLRQMWHRWRVGALFLACYAALLLVWPWAIPRLLIPIVPLIVLTLLLGATALGARLGPRGWIVPLTLGSLIAFTAIARNVVRLEQASACDRSRAASSPACFSDDQRGFFSAAKHARATTGSGARFALASKWSTFGYYARREVLPFRAPAGMSGETILDSLAAAGVRHVLLSHASSFDVALARQLRASCDRLVLARAFNRQTLLFEMRDRAAADETAGGCAALAAYDSVPGVPGQVGLW